MTRKALILAVVLLILVAGCNTGSPTTSIRSTTESSGSSPTTMGTTSQRSSTATTQQAETVPVYGQNLPVNATKVYLRVERLLGVDGRPPDVVVRHPSELSDSGGFAPGGEFGKVLGIRGKMGVSPKYGTGGFVSGNDIILTVNNETTAADIERTLAHEFTHILLRQTAEMEDTAPKSATITADRSLAKRAISEGAATYVANRYTERYLPDTPTESEIMRGAYDDVPTGIQLYWTWYLSGARYFEQRAGGTHNVTQVYERPPWTTEQVLHGYGPDEETPVALDPSIDAPEAWADDPRTTMGELFVRVALETQLSRDRAAKAATGWGNDVRATYQHENQTGYVWVLRWDSRVAADEFEAALRTYLDRRATERDGLWHAENATFRPERLDDRTVALYIGPQAFVENTTASVE